MKHFKNLFRGLALLFIAALFFFSFNKPEPVSAAPKSTQNLRTYENNLDILGDKDNSLHQLIEQLQNQRVDVTSAPAEGSGGNVLVPGMSTDDHIAAIVVHSSANLVMASTTTGQGVTGATLTFTSRILGDAGNNITIAITQQASSTSFLVRDLTIVTTGYNIEVKLSSNALTLVSSTAAAVAEAVNAHPIAGKLVKASYNGTGQGVVPTHGRFFIGTGTAGSGSVKGSFSMPLQYATISSSQTVTLSTSAPVRATDGLEFRWFDSSDNP